ncbi:cytochrome c-type biogenesis protein CcmH [Labrys wisconsinensis]|uniref:Cytochrome c-type biogenesis protein CcmH n=1 Tax=Labrys wisconsinensis TaxID=425677 RepID=A0ABU0J641_9HYPH|nr:cytochrome c-type biogenesis protein CcmH [Labrys wisconsinensis]
MFWIVIAVMTGAAALALLWPLARRDAAPDGHAGDIAVYKDQLAEVERDRDRGLIGGAEAEAARIEISRRLIAADAAGRGATAARPSRTRQRAAALAVLVAIPALGLGVYGFVGSPSLPDQPLEARLEASPDTLSLDELVARVEAMLAKNPQDGRAWEVLAPIYLRAGRADDAVQAYGNALRILGSTARRESDYGEAVTVAASNVVTADARKAFERAVALQPDDARAGYYLGLAKEQDGDKQGALADWTALLARAPAASQTAAFLRREIARVGGAPAPDTAGGPSAEEVAAAQQMTPEDRARMVRGMVEGLAERLKSGGGSLEDWSKLVRAYSVLGDKDKAATAVVDGRKALSASPDALKTFNDLVKGLGLEG